MVQSDAGRGQHADGGLARHGRAAEDGQAVASGHLDDLEHLRVTVGDELGHGLPDTETVLPLLGYLVDLRAEAEADVRLGDRVRHLVGRGPEDLHRAGGGLR